MNYKERVLLPERLKGELEKGARAKYPEEACALLIGKKENQIYKIERVKIVENIWPVKEERKRRYQIDPRKLLFYEKEAEISGLEVIGIFHSHPDYPAFPSAFDMEVAWEGYVYLIGRVERVGLKEIRAFLFKEKEGFKEIELKTLGEEVQDVC